MNKVPETSEGLPSGTNDLPSHNREAPELRRRLTQRQLSMLAIGGAIGSSIGGCFALIYPVLLLIFMTRPKLAAAFQPGPGGAGFPPG